MRGHHVALRVPDFAVAKSWYVEKLDFRVVHEWPFADEQLAYLAPPNDDHFMIEILGGGDPLPIDRPPYTDLGDSLRYSGLHHLCLNVANIDATVAELRRRGVTIVTEPFWLEAISRKLAFFADPFGNLIELAEVV
jgi:lactoylglutathione lyase/glyoxylase I family protein